MRTSRISTTTSAPRNGGPEPPGPARDIPGRVARSAVVLDYPSRRSVNRFAAALFELKRRVEAEARPFALFSPDEVADAFRENGFHITDSRPQFLLPMALHRGMRSAAASRLLEAPARALGLTRWMGSPVIARADRRS